MTIAVSPKLDLITPHGYEKTPLSGLKKWTEALRSGIYKQGSDYLHNDGAYCCLGVLCELQGRPVSESSMHCGRFRYDDDDQVLSDENPAHAVFGDEGVFPSGVQAVLHRPNVQDKSLMSLANLNDYEVEFADIATVIEHLWYDPEVAP